MSQTARMLFSVEGFIAATFVGTMWLWVAPNAEPLVSQFDGPFSASYDFLGVAIPVLVAVYYLIFGAYLLYGPVEEERTRSPRRRV